ncbi:hypothetical protein BVY02_02705 [bacterium J17]|nr:hypothetical protein BVY02_02705 [bacterium J17]
MSLLAFIRDFFFNIYHYREYLKQSVARDLRKRYKRSILGYVWSMLQPLLMMTILAVVFSKIMNARTEDYAVFLFTGMLPWAYFSATSKGALASIRANSKIIDQLAVPKYLFTLSIAFSSLVDFFLSLVPLFLVMIFFGRSFHLTMLALPIILVPLFFVTIGLSLIFAVGNVFFEDTQHLVTVILQAVYYLCPVLYSRDMLPAWLIKWIVLNPMFCIIEFMRGLFYYGTMPDPNTYFINFAGTLLVLCIGLWVFKRTEQKFIYFM